VLRDYLKDQSCLGFLLRQFEDENGNQTVKRLSLPGNERLIAQAINRINEAQL
jgi:hypothetical protein